jgi:predicted RecA/RadA family phage recombinase
MAETFRTDGKAVDVTAPKALHKGDPVVANGFTGIAMSDVASGDTVAIEVAQRVHALNLGAVAGAMGASLYITSAGALSATASGNTLFGKVVRAKDSNNVAWVRLAAQ